MPNDIPPNLRPELSEQAFRRFEPAIRVALESFPTPVLVDWTQTGLRYNTFLSRLRDAIKSFRTYQWHCDWYDPQTYGARLGQIKCSSVETNHSVVRIGPVGGKECEPLAMAYSGPAQHSTVPAVDYLELPAGLDFQTCAQLLTCYAVLASARITNLPKLYIPERPTGESQVMVDLLTALGNQYDVASTPATNPPGWFLF